MLGNILYILNKTNVTKHPFYLSTRGATAVEFAFVAPVFLLMVFGSLELARAMYIKASMQYAVEETARFVMVNQDSTTGEVEAEALTRYAGPNGANVTFIADNTTDTAFMDITATYTFDFIIPITGMPQINLQAQSKTPIN